MKWYHYEYLRTSTKTPDNIHFIIEASDGDLYLIETADKTKLYKSADKGENWSQIDVDPNDTSGDNKSRMSDIFAHFYDRTNELIYFCDTANEKDIWILTLSDDSVAEQEATTTALAINMFDIYKVGANIYPWWTLTDPAVNIWVHTRIIGGGGFSVSMGAKGARTYEASQVVYDGSTYFYFLWKWSDGNVELWRWTRDVNTWTEMEDCGANTELPPRKQGAIAYDGSNGLNFVLQDTSNSKYYLYSYEISTDTLTKGAEYNIALMLDRNTASGGREKGFHLTEYKVYQIGIKAKQYLHQLAVKLLDDTILAITDNLLMTDNGKLYELVDKSSLIANCIIWSPMYQGSKAPRPFGYPRSMPYVNWDKRYQMCLIRVGKSNEAYFQELDKIEILDDSGTTSFFGRISIKQDRLTSYILWCYSWGDEFMESVFPTAFENKRTDEILKGLLDKSSFSTYDP